MSKKLEQIALKFNSVLISFGILIDRAWAQEAEAENKTGFGGLSFKWFEGSTQIDLLHYGALRVLAYIASFLIMWMVLYTMWIVIKVSWMYLQSRGDSGAVEKASETARELIKGILVTFLWMAIYAGFSMFMGVGNIFRWPEALTQCGDGTPYFQAEYNIRQFLKEEGYEFNDNKEYKLSGYCCDARPLSLSAENLTYKIKYKDPLFSGNIEAAYIIYRPDLIIGGANLVSNGKGWYFVNAPVNDNILNEQFNNQCRVVFD